MSYSDSFPQQRPTLNLDFANSGKLDSRLSYSRSSTGTAFSAEKHLSSLNLLKYSTAFDNAAWGTNNMPAPTTGQTDPSGGTGGCILIANTTNGSHNKFQSQVTSGELSFTVFAKPASGTMRMMLNLYNAANNWEVFLFDLVGGTPVAASGTSSTFSNVSATQTASGNGYYKCTIKATGSITSALVALNPNATTSGLDAYGDISFAGDNTAGITVAFASLSTVGSSDYNATTTQIHREYSSTLKSYSSDQPRFEFATDGQSEGLLIEQQFQQHMYYTEEFDNTSRWTGAGMSIQPNAGVAPDGTLSADLLVEADEVSGNNYHYIYQHPLSSVSVGQTYTATIYAKAAGRNHVTIWTNIGGASTLGTFDLTDGSVTSSSGSGSFSSNDCGNGWYRLQLTFTTVTNAANSINFYTSNGVSHGYTGNGYGSVLLWGANLTQTSSSMSYLKAEGSQTTKSADSCSVALSQINYSGGEVTLVSETASVADDFRQAASLITDSSNQVTLYGNSSSSRLGAVIGGGQTSILTQTSADGISALSFGVNDIAATRNGASPTTDTSQSFPELTGGTLKIGGSGTNQPLDGHIKRLALYNVALSDTELQAITS
jgi:hypothetical protein